MADEEAVLKKKLEDTTDFEERRAIRQQLRDLRKKKLDALESGTTAVDRPRRRERVKREEQTTVITETKADDDTSHPATQTKIEVNYSCTVTTDGPAENGVRDEPKESKGSVENENSVEDETPSDDLQGENGTQFSVEINGEKSPQDRKPKQVDSTPQKQSSDSETVTESSCTADAEAVSAAEEASNEDQTEEVELTPEVVETIEDVDMLERLLKEVPLNEYALRKAIRLQIRQLRVKKASQKRPRGTPKFSTEASAPKGMRSERFSVDIQDKGELQKLRADLLREKEIKDKDSVSTTTEKVTEVEQVDGGQMTKEVSKTTEVHKGPGGATMTVTKTTSKTEVRQTRPGKGTSIEAMLAQKRKEKMMAKKQQQADTRNKRMAFKEKLEAQSPKVAGGGRTFQSGNAAINSLQEWCRRRTKYHEGVDIQNFTTSWANGLAMCALLNYFLPEKIPFDTLDPKDKRGNWTLAFKVANEEGIEPLLELEDVMAVDIPEPKSLITYVHFIYQHFTEKQQQQKEG